MGKGHKIEKEESLRFNEWTDELTKLSNKLGLWEINEEFKEFATFHGMTLQVMVAKEKIEYRWGSPLMGNTLTSAKYLRTEFTKFKEEFQDVLESLTDKVDTHVRIVASVMELLSQDQIPGAVMARMQGDKDVSAESQDLIKKSALAKIKEMVNYAEDALKETIHYMEGPVSYNLAWMKDINLSLSCAPLSDGRVDVDIDWGTIKFGTLMQSEADTFNAEQAMYFVSNFDFMMGKLKAFCHRMVKFEEEK